VGEQKQRVHLCVCVLCVGHKPGMGEQKQRVHLCVCVCVFFVQVTSL